MRNYRSPVFITLAILLLLLAGGLYFNLSAKFIIRSQSFNTALRWCSLPALLLSAFIAYKATFGNRYKMTFWNSFSGFTGLLFVISILSFLSFEGTLIALNRSCGSQKDTVLTGKVIRVEHPRRPKPLNSCSIYIERETLRDTLRMEVPYGEWLEGDFFSKNMREGSLGFIYMKKEAGK